MSHLSENSTRLHIRHLSLNDDISKELSDVCLIILPSAFHGKGICHADVLQNLLKKILHHLGPEATLITVGETTDLVHIHSQLASSVNYQLWISIKRLHPKRVPDNSALPEHHIGALVHTKYKGALKHTKTRIQYTYCPACDKTTKDYGGKKHTYNPYGTLISDVWRDICVDSDGDLGEVIERFADLFGIRRYTELFVIDCREILSDIRKSDPGNISEENAEYAVQPPLFGEHLRHDHGHSRLIRGDVMKELSQLPDNSADFAFADPPYNLKKKYNDYSSGHMT